ncbi:MAG: hypothetical protein ACRD4O_00535 [Bryobacteraceae bacterium]
MKRGVWLVGLALWAQWAIGQTAGPPNPAVLAAAPEAATRPAIEPRVIEIHGKRCAARRVYLLPHFATTIRMRDTVRSVVVGDPSLFRVDHDEDDPSLVIVHPTTERPAQTNLEITTVSGQQAILWLVSDPQPKGPVDFALDYDTTDPRSFWRSESPLPSALIAETVPIGSPDPKAGIPRPRAAEATKPASFAAGASFRQSRDERDTRLSKLLAEQAEAPLPELYAQHPGAIRKEKHLEAGVSRVIDEGRTVVVLFSVVNAAPHAVALLPPQIQLAGQVKKKWTTAQQLPVLAYRLDRERLQPGDRANGVAVFERPAFKQSNESLFLQMAESGAVDQPALAPIGFGVSSRKGGIAYAADPAQ